jgi:hypothetical protein
MARGTEKRDGEDEAEVVVIFRCFLGASRSADLLVRLTAASRLGSASNASSLAKAGFPDKQLESESR